jgi:hypothetical protein
MMNILTFEGGIRSDEFCSGNAITSAFAKDVERIFEGKPCHVHSDSRPVHHCC